MLQLDQIIAVSWWAIIPLIIVGSLLHFAFDWTGHNRIVAVFAAVNESYWEHIKIAAWPAMALYVGLFVAGGYAHPAFLPAATIALYSIPMTMIGLVFAYKALARRNILWLDITVFGLTIVLAQMLFVTVIERFDANSLVVVLSVLYLGGIVTAYFVFTHRPPREPDVFIDPITQKYGVDAHPGLSGPAG